MDRTETVDRVPAQAACTDHGRWACSADSCLVRRIVVRSADLATLYGPDGAIDLRELETTSAR